MSSSTPESETAGPLLATKFYPPRWRAGLVSRAHLVERLERGVSSGLTLVAAPAGSGKTTLLGEWLAAHPDRPVAWLSLDRADSDPQRYWTYVIAAIRGLRAGFGVNALAMLQSPQPPPIETVLAEVLNEIAAGPSDVTLVLDDYHVIESAEIQDAMAFLVDRQPPQLHLVIVSRADPALPLARLRVGGALTEIRAAELRFSDVEAASFLNEVMGLRLNADDVRALEERTEGWVAGLQLAALSMQGRDDAAGFVAAFTGDDRYVVDYLVEEVLARQPAQVRDFLLRTSILDRLSGALCDAVTGFDDGAATLESLERANLFVIPLDDRRRWYRYHHLFADVLRAHLREEQPDRMPELHRRASEWYARQGESSDAIAHALAGHDFDRAAALIESVARETVSSYRPLLLLEWLRALPDDVVTVRPVLSMYYAFALFAAGEMDEAGRRLDDADAGLAAGTGRAPHAGPAPASGNEAEFRALPGTIALARGYHALALGDVAGTIERARRSLELLPEDEDTWRGGAALLLALAEWAVGDLDQAAQAHAAGVASLERSGDIPLAVSALYDGATLAVARGRLAEAGRMLERALRLAAEAGNPDLPGVADAHLGMSDLAIERGDLDAAAAQLDRAEALARLAVLPETPARLCIARAALHEARGQRERALEELDRAERLVVPGPVPAAPVHARRARIWITLGRSPEVERWTREHALSPGDDLSYAREFEHLTLARMLIAGAARTGERGGARAALRLLDGLRVEAENGARAGSVLDILVLQALAHRALGDAAAALGPLGQALAAAEPEAYVRLFVEHGEPMRELLRGAIAAGESTAYAGRLLDALGVEVAADAAAAGLPEPLTAREVEILRLIAAGLRNQEIADRLVISVATVKRHIANTYGKLGVAHRTEAVARANELRLI